MDAQFWNERYSTASRLWSGNPNPILVQEVEALPRGRALEVGCGEGADALWLARKGYTVTAVDFSDVALSRAAEHAAEAGADIAARVTFEQHDVTTWTPPQGSFDLVTVHYLHMPSATRAPIYRRLAEAVAPGGHLLVVGHHSSDLKTGIKRPPNADLLFTAAQAAEEAGAGFVWLTQEDRPRTVKDSEGREVTVHDAVLLGRRT